MIKNIIFDIGNVLVGFDWKDFFAGFGYSEEITERLANATVKNPFWNEIDRGVMSEEEILEGFIAKDPGIESELRKTYEDYGNLLNQFDYAKGLIKDLQNKGFKVYCLSNMSHKAVRECKALDFLDMLDGYVLSCDVKLIKPDPAIYETLLNTYGLDAKESVFIDDLDANIETALSLGMHGIVFKDLKSAISELEDIVTEEEQASIVAKKAPAFEENIGTSATDDSKSTTSRYTKAQRIGALSTVILIGVILLAMLILAFVGTEWSARLVRILFGAAIVLPILAWAYIWMIGKMTHKKTIADFNFFDEN